MTFISASTVQNQLPHRTTALCGFSKGSGKTTAFAWARHQARASGPVALLTIGSHQRSHTATDGSSQPELRLDPGDIVLTTLPQAKISPASLEILDIVPGRSNQGRLILGRARRCGTVSLVGPEHLSSLQSALELIRQEKWAQAICIDGAANRITQLAALSEVQFIYTMQVAPDNLNASLEHLQLLDELVNLEVQPAEATAYCLDGPLTTTALEELPSKLKELSLSDFSKVFLNSAQWRKLTAQTRVTVRQRIPLLCALLVAHDLSAETLQERLAALRLPILLNPLQERDPLPT